MNAKTKKNISLLGAFVCLIGIGYLSGVFTKTSFYYEINYRAVNDECVWHTTTTTTTTVFDENTTTTMFRLPERGSGKSSGQIPEWTGKECYEKIELRYCPSGRFCESEQVFDPRSTAVVALVGLLGVFVFSAKRYALGGRGR